LRFGLAIIAHDIYDSLQIWRHGLFSDIARSSLPSSCHGLLRDDSLLADGATVVKASKFAEAMSVNGVAAWQVLWRLTRREHVFAAHGAIVFVLILETIVRMKDIDADTHAAFSAVSERLHATNSAETAFVAMERFLRSCHPEVADPAMVFTEDSVATNAQVAVVERIKRGKEVKKNVSWR
jgi:hypothetical protein